MDVARRVFCGILVTGVAGWVAEIHDAQPGPAQPPARVEIEEFDEAGRALGVRRVEGVRKPDAEWKRILSPDAFSVTRRADTELAFAGEYLRFRGDGLYRCVACGTALFDSKDKFSSGNGWPGFRRPISDRNVVRSADRSWGLSRTAVNCRRCNSHLGHVFGLDEAGEKADGVDYCINSVALRFHSRDLT